METPAHISRNRIVGGNTALDFVNTQTGPPDGPPEDEALLSYDDLVHWARHVRLLGDADTERLLSAGGRRRREAETAYIRAHRLRATLFSLFRAVARGEQPDSVDLAALRDAESEAIAHGRLAPRDGRLEWRWDDEDSLTRPLWPVIHSAVELLTGPDRERIKACAGCRFLFVDTSRNGSRRWCAMEDCGTAAKSRTYVARRRTRRLGTDVSADTPGRTV